MYTNWVKPFFDFIVAFIAFIILSPIIIIVTVLMSIVNKGNPFFIQARPGKAGLIFHLIKFKTMIDKTDENGNLLPDDLRMTSIGRLVRKTSLDELPQLINVLKGEMSLVGPRPLLVEYLPLFSTEQARRHEVKPGITGWAQVNGRNAISWEKKFELDVWYVDHISFLLDVKILFQTIIHVILRKNIHAPGEVTAQKFTGNLNNQK